MYCLACSHHAIRMSHHATSNHAMPNRCDAKSAMRKTSCFDNSIDFFDDVLNRFNVFSSKVTGFEKMLELRYAFDINAKKK